MVTVLLPGGGAELAISALGWMSCTARMSVYSMQAYCTPRSEWWIRLPRFGCHAVMAIKMLIQRRRSWRIEPVQRLSGVFHPRLDFTARPPR